MKLYMRFIEKLTTNNFLKTNKLFFILLITCFFIINTPVFANELRTIFKNNSAVIYTINLRTFGAKDYNNDDLIETELGEVKGTFVNAIPKLKALKDNGINTVYLLPITKTGKLKALGTAGSLYALDAFDVLNPQLYDETDIEVDINKQAKKFVDAAHKLNLHVIVDLPACGSYDFSLSHPELFKKNSKNETVIPADWTDVRLFEPYGSDKTSLNNTLLDEYKKFIDLMLYLGVDGIRADVAAIKPQKFWNEVINYARSKDSEFLFLAEASPAWNSPKGYEDKYLTCEELLEAGFDGYYEDWSDLSKIKSAKEFYKKINNDIKILSKFDDKSVIGAFATHDQIAPSNFGKNYWEMVNWLNMLLPLNPYVLDGFQSADRYIYKFQGKKPDKTYTDNSNSYDLKKGYMDIFNFSRAPFFFNSKTLIDDFANAVDLRYLMKPIITSKNITFLNTSNDCVFAFKRQQGQDSIIVVGNLNDNMPIKAKVKISNLSKKDLVMPVKMNESPITSNGSMEVKLQPFEIQTFVIRKTLD